MKNAPEVIEIKDKRKPGFYFMDDLFIDVFGKIKGIGAYGCAVCNSLVRHSDKQGKSFPSIELIAREWGISKSQVIRCIEVLEIHNIIEIVREQGKHNIYQLLNKTLWIPEPVSTRHQLEPEPVSTRHPTSVYQTPEGNTLRILNTTNARARGFEAFKKLYPKKRSWGDAEKAWNQLKPSEHLTSIILSAVQRAMTSEDWTKECGKYIPYPATYLRAKGWEDEFPEKAASPRPRAGVREPVFFIDKDGNKCDIKTGAPVNKPAQPTRETPEQIRAAIAEGLSQGAPT